MTSSRERISWLLGLAVLLSSTGCGDKRPSTAKDRKDDFLVPPEEGPTDVQPPPPRKRKRRDRRHHAALLTMLDGKLGHRMDKDAQARFPLVDVEGWTRVRFSLIKHFTGFRYGKDHHGITVAFVIPMDPTGPKTSAACIERFEADSRPQIHDVGGHVTELATVMTTWRKQPLVVRTGMGEVDVFFRHHEAAMAWTGYPAYPDACMVYAVVVPLGDSKEEAVALRDRWVGILRRFRPMTDVAPYRH